MSLGSIAPTASRGTSAVVKPLPCHLPPRQDGPVVRLGFGFDRFRFVAFVANLVGNEFELVEVLLADIEFFSGDALHEKGLKRQEGVVPLVGRQEQEALLVPLLESG